MSDNNSRIPRSEFWPLQYEIRAGGPVDYAAKVVMVSPRTGAINAMRAIDSLAETLGHKPWNQLKKEERNPVASQFVKDINDKKEEIIGKIGRGESTEHSKDRIEEAHGRLIEVMATVNPYEDRAKTLLKPAIERVPNVKNLSPDELKNNDDIKAILSGVYYKANNILTSHSDNGKYYKEFEVLLNSKDLGSVLAGTMLNHTVEEAKKAAPQETLGHIENARGDKLPLALQEQARKAAAGTQLEIAPEGGAATTAIDSKLITEKAKGGK